MTDGYVYVAEVNYADTTPAEQTEYHGTAALATGAAFTRAPNAFIADRLVTPEIPAEHLFQPRCTRGRRGNPRETQVRFRNRDGALDGWKSQAFQGRAFQLWRTTRANLGNFAQYLSAFAGTADQPAVDTNE
ncbi:MAG TPA: hypothetical protein VEB23_11855, partial [Ramlibacter sp.]|nr:hypothetical protein [Ramlibacter sp.]